MATRYPSDETYAALRHPVGRLKAHANLLFVDHGILRPFYNRPVAISDEIWRSAQPSTRGLRWAERAGIRTIVNLRGPSYKTFYALEAEKCAKLGLVLVDFRTRSRDAPAPDFFHRAREMFETIEYPALMHCKSGADRAGLMSALYLMFRKNVPVEEALRQLSLRYGHFRHAKTGLLDAVLEAYRDHNATTPTDFLDWVDTAYDPEAIKADFHVGAVPSFLVEKVLRRE